MQRITIAALFALSLVACNTGAPNPTTPPAPPAGGTACPATITIGPGNAYSPSSCTMKVGQTVTISASSVHPLSGSGAGQTVTSQTSAQAIGFTTAGTFNFACDVHGGGGMKGAITVSN